MAIKLIRALPPSQRLAMGLSHARTAPIRARDFQRFQNPGPAPWVIEECFKRLKATSMQYGIGGMIKYGCYLPLKSLIFGLTGDQQAKLELYNQHQLLSTGISKVEKACKKFLKAEQVTHKASDLAKARFDEFCEANDFINSYDELIALSARQASGNHISESCYLQDLHGALAQRGEGLIFRTLNRARAKFYLVNGTIGSETEGRYRAFVANFGDHVNNAAKSAGSTSLQTIKVITQGFIEGLASFSELDSVLKKNLEKLSLISREIHTRVGDQLINNKMEKQNQIILEAYKALKWVERMQDLDLYLTIRDPAHDPIHRVLQAALADEDELLGPEFPADDSESEIETIAF